MNGDRPPHRARPPGPPGRKPPEPRTEPSQVIRRGAPPPAPAERTTPLRRSAPVASVTTTDAISRRTSV
ncbi:hypothetical protein A5681_18965 [Mycobacterium scrofulaceum]|nr:hypothetical protein A5681_18965 [Mycobacterium scrofulaceum]